MNYLTISERHLMEKDDIMDKVAFGLNCLNDVCSKCKCVWAFVAVGRIEDV